MDYAVDIRFGSPTFGKYEVIELSSENNLQFWIPEGFAHGFCVLKDDTIMQYKCTAFYSKKDERGIIYNDPDLAIDWKISNPIVSERDVIKPCQVRLRLRRAMRRVPKAPMAPASVGVKNPQKSPPITKIKRINVSTSPERDAIFSLKVVFGPLGASSGLRCTQMVIVRMKSIVRSRPGRMPAMKSLPMDCSVIIP